MSKIDLSFLTGDGESSELDLTAKFQEVKARLAPGLVKIAEPVPTPVAKVMDRKDHETLIDKLRYQKRAVDAAFEVQEQKWHAANAEIKKARAKGDEVGATRIEKDWGPGSELSNNYHFSLRSKTRVEQLLASAEADFSIFEKAELARAVEEKEVARRLAVKLPTCPRCRTLGKTTALNSFRRCSVCDWPGVPPAPPPAAGAAGGGGGAAVGACGASQGDRPSVERPRGG